MATYTVQGSTMTDIADAIRDQTGETAMMSPTEMPSKIRSIAGSSGVDLPEVTTENDGQVLGVVNGEWGVMDVDIPKPGEAVDELPKVTSDNNGQFLGVENGEWTNVTPRVVVASDGYTDITGLRQPVGISMQRSGTTVTIQVTLQGNKTSTTTITLDAADRPTKFTSNGITGSIAMGGFDD